MSNVFSHAGVSRLNGEFKVRFCNDALRVRVLAKNGHKDIDIVELRHPMSKADAVAFLMSIDFANGNKEVQAALEAAADKRGVTAPKAKAPAKKPVAKKAAPKAKKSAVISKSENVTVKAPAVNLADLEDAPFDVG